MARAFAREGLDVKLRRSREKPLRTVDMERERVDLCDEMRRWPLRRFTDTIDMTINNKRFAIPTTPEARAHLARQQVVSQLRTRSEGLRASFTKPNAKARRENFGGSVIVCAGISNCRVLLWECFTEWSGQIAPDMYDFSLWAHISRRVESAPRWSRVCRCVLEAASTGGSLNAKQHCARCCGSHADARGRHL